MSQRREEILADFQACTGIEDLGEAIHHLEEANWDLLAAVNRVMPADSQSFSNRTNHQEVITIDDEPSMSSDAVETVAAATAAGDMMDISNHVGHSRSESGPSLENSVNFHQPSTSKSHTPEVLHFDIQYCDKTISMDIPNTATIMDIKLRIHEELKISPCRQLLSGWARLSQYENTSLSQLSLPKNNFLILNVTPVNGGLGADDSEIADRIKGTYTLIIKDEATGKISTVKYEGTKTILGVKSDAYSFTNIHVRNQVWTGWPPNIGDQTMLAFSGISYPTHHLTVRQDMTNHTRERKSNIVEIPDSDDDEFEDATETFSVDDEIFVDNLSSTKHDPLIPEYVEDEVVGSINFSEHFNNRYSPVHLNFYQGTLDDALKEACQKPAKERKILAVYLHHDASVLANIFCTKLLGCESVNQILENNFILWGWDLTFESNKTMLHTSVNNCLGSTAAISLRNIPVDRLPAIIIIMRIRSSTDVFSIIHGNLGVNELLSSLMEAVDVFMENQRVEVKEEDERAARELVKWEQDQAYQESLEADRAKEEAKRLQEFTETQERQRLATEKAEEAAKKEAYRKQVAESLPCEPNLEQIDNITKIRFRLPRGEFIERRFLSSTNLKTVLDFLVVKGYPTEEYKVISSWPRRDLTSLDSARTLQELQLCPKETVILEER